MGHDPLIARRQITNMPIANGPPQPRQSDLPQSPRRDGQAFWVYEVAHALPIVSARNCLVSARQPSQHELGCEVAIVQQLGGRVCIVSLISLLPAGTKNASCWPQVAYNCRLNFRKYSSNEHDLHPSSQLGPSMK
jgi:hypothetical protein